MNLSCLFSRLIPKRCRRPAKDLTDRSVPALEQRTLLATLVGNNKVTYQDINGDNVTVTFSKPLLDSLNVGSVMQFNGAFGDSGPQSLLRIDLSAAFPSLAVGTSITTVATRSATNGGDGFANIGEILSGGVDIGNVTIDGDLGKISAGDGNFATQGLGALKVHSMGRFGTTTGAADLNSTIQGRLASLTAKTDLKNVRIETVGGTFGTIGAVTVGGSLIGGSGAGSGSLLSSWDMGAVKITGDVVGGLGTSSGQINSQGKLASVSIGGSLIGASGQDSGFISSSLAMGAVSIGGDIVGGAGAQSGGISGLLTLSSVSVGGSVRGSSGLSSGRIAALGNIGTVTIQGNLIGGSNDESGAVLTIGEIAAITVHGSLIGGTSNYTGSVATEGAIRTVTVSGSLKGGSGILSGSIQSLNTAILVANIKGSLLGGSGRGSGSITAVAVEKVSIGGSVIGGTDLYSGTLSGTALINSVVISKDIVGGGGFGAGAVISGRLGALSLGGSIIGGTADRTGVVYASDDIGTATIGGSIIGGGTVGTTRSGQVFGRQIKSMTMNGSLIAGAGLYNGAIIADADIGSLTIKGSVRGTATNRALIMAEGQRAPTSTVDLAIGKLTINGRVERASILAGFEDDGPITDRNADAQIGTVVVTGDWIASDMVAGGRRGVDGFFGSADDRKMSGAGIKDVATVISRINSVTIGGQVVGSIEDNNDRFGFVAELVGSFKVKGGTTTFPLMANAGNDNLFVGIGIGGFPPDTWLRELTI